MNDTGSDFAVADAKKEDKVKGSGGVESWMSVDAGLATKAPSATLISSFKSHQSCPTQTPAPSFAHTAPEVSDSFHAPSITSLRQKLYDRPFSRRPTLQCLIAALHRRCYNNTYLSRMQQPRQCLVCQSRRLNESSRGMRGRSCRKTVFQYTSFSLDVSCRARDPSVRCVRIV